MDLPLSGDLEDANVVVDQAFKDEVRALMQPAERQQWLAE